MEPERPRAVEQIRGLVDWIGAGRKPTRTGRTTLADARVLVALPETGGTIDPSTGDRTFETESSQELYHLNPLVERAEAARLLRATGGRLVPVEKNARLLEDPERSAPRGSCACGAGRRGGSGGEVVQFVGVELGGVEVHAGEVAREFEGEDAVEAGPEVQGAA